MIPKIKLDWTSMQSSNEVAPGKSVVRPEGQTLQVSDDLAPTSFEYVPAKHSLQFPFPSL